MDADTSSLLRRLLAERPVAALATLHRGEPAVSMVPFVLPAQDTRLFIHVSGLATHTRDLLEHPRVGLLVTAADGGPWPAQALPRVSLQADAVPLPREGGDYAAAKALYLARFPDSAQTFELGDFGMFALQPVSARLIGGFGRAHSLVAEGLSTWLREPA
ncbi:pyridoxamine 5'-phosphate oxidase family protein [Azohydromonas lata]|uniref:Pyridoxamine 5'-phosphate oxidase family protein n=1 Tax=Azohydromonas lata TaxID=45677 RepID=A0ABU5IRP2_9BURK|nr:pyridoxamine 5'-phosphate oxidase family protein [Azohydromonas lata]MDZ5461557.1 pyridoxamine 5'-phosphate oxidase family protein [Azohydromonas lata]